jgi:hypothetical protein
MSIKVNAHGCQQATVSRLQVSATHAVETVEITTRDGTNLTLFLSPEELTRLYVAIADRMVEVGKSLIVEEVAS